MVFRFFIFVLCYLVIISQFIYIILLKLKSIVVFISIGLFIFNLIAFLNNLVFNISIIFRFKCILFIKFLSIDILNWIFLVKTLISYNNRFFWETVKLPVIYKNVYIYHTNILWLLFQCFCIQFSQNILFYTLCIQHFS